MKQFFQTHANGNKQETAAALYYMGKQEISMKNVADAVEALIGTYLQASYGFITIIIQLRFGPLRDRVVCKKYAYDTKKKKK